MASSSPNSPISINNQIKTEPLVYSDHFPAITVPESEKQQQSPNPNLVPSQISQLQSIHAALSTFLQSYSSFSETLNSISSSLDSTKPNQAVPSGPSKPDKKLYLDPSKPGKNVSLDLICQNNLFKPLRQYITAHISDLPKLHQEVPHSLALSPNPSRLVLNGVGKFYIRGRKAYEGKDEQAILVRRISILLLEYYLLAGCPVGMGLDTDCENDAMAAAIIWRKRLKSEGGVEGAGPDDALGLSLLIGCFGVPKEFEFIDIYWLLKLSNLKMKGELLKKSKILVEKMPDIIKYLIRKEKNVEAVDLICAFGLEDKFMPIPLLSSIVEKTCEDESDGRSIRSLKETNEKQLNALKSVVKCLEEHNLDSTELSKTKISQKISKLERKLQENNAKRKFDDVQPSRNQYARAKRHMPRAAESPFRQGFDQGASSVHDSRHSTYNGHTADFYASQVKQHMHLAAEASFNHSLERGISSVQDSRYATYNGHTADVNASQGVVAQNAWYGNALCQGNAQSALQIHSQLPATNQIHNQSSAAMQNYYQSPAASQIQNQSSAAIENYYQPHATGQIHHQSAAVMQNYYQPPAAGQIQYQGPVADQNHYYPNATSQVNEGWSAGSALPTATHPFQHTLL